MILSALQFFLAFSHGSKKFLVWKKSWALLRKLVLHTLQTLWNPGHVCSVCFSLKRREKIQSFCSLCLECPRFLACSLPLSWRDPDVSFIDVKAFKVQSSFYQIFYRHGSELALPFFVFTLPEVSTRKLSLANNLKFAAQDSWASATARAGSDRHGPRKCVLPGPSLARWPGRARAGPGPCIALIWIASHIVLFFFFFFHSSWDYV